MRNQRNLIYLGITDNCLPKVYFPQGFNVTCAANHWSNEEKAMEHFDTIILLYIGNTKEEFRVLPIKRVLLIYDVFKGQTTTAFVEYVESNEYVFVPEPRFNC